MTGWFISFILSFVFEYCLFGKSLVIHLSYFWKQWKNPVISKKLLPRIQPQIRECHSASKYILQCQGCRRGRLSCLFQVASQCFLILISIIAQESLNTRQSFIPTPSRRIWNAALFCAELNLRIQLSSLMWGG